MARLPGAVLDGARQRGRDATRRAVGLAGWRRDVRRQVVELLLQPVERVHPRAEAASAAQTHSGSAGPSYQ
eukprot:6803049-Prymnesium_polylepis.2